MSTYKECKELTIKSDGGLLVNGITFSFIECLKKSSDHWPLEEILKFKRILINGQHILIDKLMDPIE